MIISSGKLHPFKELTSAMSWSAELQPAIRIAHDYRFPEERNGAESNRYGYCYAFHLVKGGRGRFEVEGQSFQVRKGDLLFVPPSLRHSFFSDPESPLLSGNIYCELWAPALESASGRHLEWEFAALNSAYMTTVRREPALQRLPYYLPLQQQEAMIVLFERMLHHHRQPQPLSAEIAGSLLKSFILEFVQLSQAPLAADYRIQRIMELIEREAGAGSRYESWLEASGLKKTQFHELFKQATGLSPKAFWTRSVMKQAAAALRESNRSITELASDLGYSSIHHFTKQFKAYYGVSPTGFRQGSKLPS